MSQGRRGRLSGASAVALLGLSLACAAAIVPAEADKVGVAAAVNPDAFSSLAGSPQSQLSIGKSIFYNERINTTGSGLVQVLLVDGSTFTVGPGSDLVIDKFVYDPKKGTGQIAASFSKGVMRFVGGKLSKNDGGVTVDTPAGALAIRGGIAFADFKSATNYSVLFVFGEYVKMGGKTLYMPGYGWFMNNGQFNSRPFDSNDLKTILAALTNGNPNPTPTDTPKPNSLAKLFNTQSMSQLISDANTTQIQSQADKALVETTDGPPPCTELCDGGLGLGYAGGLYNQSSTGQNNDDDPVGVVTSQNSTQVAFAFNFPEGSNYANQNLGPAPSFSANFELSAGAPWEQQGGIDIIFGNPTPPANFLQRRSWIDQGDGLFAINASNGINIYGDDGPDEPHKIVGLPVAALLSSDFGPGFGEDLDLCNGCNSQGGTFTTLVTFIDDPDYHGQGRPRDFDRTTVAILGWWIAGDIPAVSQLPFTGSATYLGNTIATVSTDLLNNEGWTTYVATGNVEMNWNFAKHTGNMKVSNFDASHFDGGLTFSGKMCAPGVTSCGSTPGGQWKTPNGNHFGGPLTGQLPNTGLSSDLSQAERDLNGFALGSFVRGLDNYNGGVLANGPISQSIPQGTIGNWAVGNDHYMASGVFGASRPVPTQ